MKIENAIILAAGRGSRLGDLTNDRPKCMMEINDKTVIQRLIEVLKYKHINNIVVVTGYKSGILRKHLNEIDRNIKTVENILWKTTNSISSMMFAAKYLKNTIVIDSDIYISNPRCIKNDVEFSGYTAVKATRCNEWQLLTNDNGFIEKTELSGQYANGRPILDISYWLEKDSNIVAKHLSEISIHGTERDGLKFWDEIPLIDFLHQLRLKRYDISEKDAMEFDTPEELQEVRKAVCLMD